MYVHNQSQEIETLPYNSVNIKVLYIHSHSQETETLLHNAVNIKAVYIHSDSQKIETLLHNAVNIKAVYIHSDSQKTETLPHNAVNIKAFFYIRSESQEIQDNGDALHDDFLQLSSSEPVVPTVWTVQETMNTNQDNVNWFFIAIRSSSKHIKGSKERYLLEQDKTRTHKRLKRMLFTRTTIPEDMRLKKKSYLLGQDKTRTHKKLVFFKQLKNSNKKSYLLGQDKARTHKMFKRKLFIK